LLNGNGFPQPIVAYELIHYHKQTITVYDRRNWKNWAEASIHGLAVDTFACYLAGTAWREQQVGDQLIAKWARSPNRWWRRAALVSTVPLNNKRAAAPGDSMRTLLVCRLLVNDRDDMIVKALFMGLTRTSEKGRAKVPRDFLAENCDRLAPRVIREVNNKLTREEKIKGSKG